MSEKTERPSREGLRFTPGFKMRAASDGGMPTLYGTLVKYNDWTRIESVFEGTFMERIAPGAAKKTLKDNGANIRILFHHGLDPSVGKRTLCAPTFTESESEVEYSGELFDTTYNRDLAPGLETGQYGSSFRFRVVKESFDEEPGRSAHNPEGIPERVVEEMEIREGGPTPFPAYEGAVAGLRSLTDHIFMEGLKLDPTRSDELAEMFANWVKLNPKRARELVEEELRKAIPYEKTDTSTKSWDGPAMEASMPNDCEMEDLRQMFAWVDPAKDPATKAAYRFIHHEWVNNDAGPANVEACRFGISVLNGAEGGTTIPSADKQGVYDHLAKHLKDAGVTPPELKRSTEEPGNHSSPEHSEDEPGDHSTTSRANEPLYGVESPTDSPSWRL